MRAGCALIGGETAEHPGHLGPDDFDLAGAATGVVEADRLLGPHRVRTGRRGDRARLIGPARQRVLAGPAGVSTGPGWRWTPSRRNWAPRWERNCSPRPPSTPGTAWPWRPDATCTRSRTSPAAGWRRTWPGCCRPAPARCLTAPPGGRRRCSPCWPAGGGIGAAEMERVFNMGVGMAAVVAAGDADRALRVLAARDVTGWVLGEVTGQDDGARLAGLTPADRHDGSPRGQRRRVWPSGADVTRRPRPAPRRRHSRCSGP